jgi:hypothetical protein
MHRRASPPIPILVVAACLLTAPAAFAQGAPGPANNISVNPITMTFGMFNAEYGHRLDTTKTLGTSASYFSFDDADYVNANALFRYYPREAFRGFYLGGRSGVYRVSARGQSAIAFGAGPELGYDWLAARRAEPNLGEPRRRRDAAVWRRHRWRVAHDPLPPARQRRRNFLAHLPRHSSPRAPQPRAVQLSTSREGTTPAARSTCAVVFNSAFLGSVGHER